MDLLVIRNDTGKFLSGDVVGECNPATLSPKELEVFRVVTLDPMDDRLLLEDESQRRTRRGRPNKANNKKRRLFYIDSNDTVRRRS